MVAAVLPVVLVLLCTGLYAGVCAGEDAFQIAKNIDVSHLWQARQRGIALGGFALLASVAVWLEPAVPWHAHLLPLPLAGMSACFFGLLFDLWLNQRRQLVWHYTGLDPATATIDRKLAKMKVSGRLYVAAKLAGVLGCGGLSLWLRA